MLNQYPLWKNLLLLLLVAAGFFYAAPNLYVPDPALQISGESSAQLIGDSILNRATGALEAAGTDFIGAEVAEDGTSALIRLRNRDDQLPAQGLVQRALGDGYIVALNLAPTTPDWLSDFGAQPMKLGLDLSGGVHFKLEVDVEAAVLRRLEFYTSATRKLLREEGVRGFVSLEDDSYILARFRNESRREQAYSAVRDDFPELLSQRGENTADGEFTFTASLSDAMRQEIAGYAVNQNLTTLRNRVNELGVSEPLVQPQGRNRIVVELPGIQDTAEAKRILGKTANLEFRLVATADAPPSARQEFSYRGERRAGSEWLERDVIITGERVANAQASFDQNGRPNVNISLDSEGGALMHRSTRNNIKRRMGVLFIERKTRTRYETDEDGNEVAVRIPIDEKRVITAPVIQSALGAQFQITGLDSTREASELALLLRAGALAAPVDFVEERTVGPSLGAENIAKGITSVQIGLLLVVLFMVAWYRVFGCAAVVALACNLVLLVSVMSVLGATLTLPGIAGIVLTVGMAVDANVLIFARIREELRNKQPPQMAIHAGFERALVTILDANITTLLVAVILYAVGTGPVKGFAVTLSIGIVTSMITALMGTRALVNLVYGGRQVQQLSIGGEFAVKVIDFMGQRRLATALSVVLVLVSIASLWTRQLNWGLDFTGGTLVEVHYSDTAPLPEIRATLEQGGFAGAVVVSFGSEQDVLIRLPQGYSDKDGARLLALLQQQAQQKAQQQAQKAQQQKAQQQEPGSTVELRRTEYVGPQVGEELREQGGLAMLLALGLVMLYVAFRFQLKFSVGAVIALAHDVLITLGFFSLIGIEFDLTVLAALLAVIGYSLNDTIVVSDRIRENFRKIRKAEPVRVINTSLSETLARTLVTSLTTLLVLLALALFGGDMIHGFALALIVGVVIGTYSSIYVAANSLLALRISREDLLLPVKEGAELEDLP